MVKLEALMKVLSFEAYSAPVLGVMRGTGPLPASPGVATTPA